MSTTTIDTRPFALLGEHFYQYCYDVLSIDLSWYQEDSWFDDDGELKLGYKVYDDEVIEMYDSFLRWIEDGVGDDFLFMRSGVGFTFYPVEDTDGSLIRITFSDFNWVFDQLFYQIPADDTPTQNQWVSHFKPKVVRKEDFEKTCLEFLHSLGLLDDPSLIEGLQDA